MNDTIQQARLQNQMKNPIVALALGFFIPGAGQMYAGSMMWGVINLILIVVLAVTVIASPVAFILWLVSLFLGYKGTKQFNDKVLDGAEASS
ncbi:MULTISPECIES: hypothetical protein [unclassified Oleiphilus]|nr:MULTISPECIES: hypothetical protein [unclassified Oleiphilus]KZY36941.1 hypothetical protein A3729_28995 [Oleiphilus sp. HI0043]KZY37171.1 hypothetical protein A3729_28505 [Oleiphilus sp. HI0043]KZZ66996.1 hypothetical protein A3763_16710 [Oleiphilus sp. HI0128]